MTTILLVCIVMLFISRIRETPSMLSEKCYYKEIRKTVKSNEEFLNNLPCDKRIFVEKFAVYPYSLFMCLIYASIGVRVDSLEILICYTDMDSNDHYVVAKKRKSNKFVCR